MPLFDVVLFSASVLIPRQPKNVLGGIEIVR
jgi:hypothetical protein